MNKNNQLHDAHVKAYLQKQEIEFIPEFIPEDNGSEYQQTVLDLNEYQQEKIQKLHYDIYSLIHAMDVPTDILCNSIPNHILKYLYRDLLHRIGKDMVDNKYNI